MESWFGLGLRGANRQSSVSRSESPHFNFGRSDNDESISATYRSDTNHFRRSGNIRKYFQLCIFRRSGISALSNASMKITVEAPGAIAGTSSSQDSQQSKSFNNNSNHNHKGGKQKSQLKSKSAKLKTKLKSVGFVKKDMN